MPLHRRKTAQNGLLDDLYAGNDAEAAVPRVRFPQEQRDPRLV